VLISARSFQINMFPEEGCAATGSGLSLKKNTLMGSGKGNMFFQPTHNVTSCNMLLYITHQGLLLSRTKPITQFNESHLISITEIPVAYQHLLLAEEDYVSFINHENVIFEERMAVELNCQMMWAFLTNTKFPDNSFVVTKDRSNNQLIFKVDSQTLYVPSCSTVDKIFVMPKVLLRYSHIANTKLHRSSLSHTQRHCEKHLNYYTLRRCKPLS
jgi:hypothetical protein